MTIRSESPWTPPVCPFAGFLMLIIGFPRTLSTRTNGTGGRRTGRWSAARRLARFDSWLGRKRRETPRSKVLQYFIRWSVVGRSLLRSLTMFLLAVCGSELFAADDAAKFVEDVLPLLEAKCVACHGPETRVGSAGRPVAARPLSPLREFLRD